VRAENAAVGEHVVYLCRTPSGAPKYVGYGRHLARALSHAEHSHNERLREWLRVGRFDLTVSGPYRDEAEAKAVEAALISALGPEFNVAPGDGPRFLPVGVPPALAERTAQPALADRELGILTGGALVVYLAPGDFLSDGRRKYDAADPRDADVLATMRGYWDLGKHVSVWAAQPHSGPQVLMDRLGERADAHGTSACAAPPRRSRARQERGPPLRSWRRCDRHDQVGRPGSVVPDWRRWEVPLREPIDLDVADLRGRRVAGLRFGQSSWQLHKWIDPRGWTLHPPPVR
jgi:hypothetical protein